MVKILNTIVPLMLGIGKPLERKIWRNGQFLIFEYVTHNYEHYLLSSLFDYGEIPEESSQSTGQNKSHESICRTGTDLPLNDDAQMRSSYLSDQGYQAGQEFSFQLHQGPKDLTEQQLAKCGSSIRDLALLVWFVEAKDIYRRKEFAGPEEKAQFFPAYSERE